METTRRSTGRRTRTGEAPRQTRALSSKDYCVYALVDPRSDLVFYIGHTGHLALRRAQHLDGTDQLSGLFVQQMKLNGFVPLFVVLERCPNQTQALSSEIFWIEMFRARGAELLNGQGVGGAVARKEKRRDLTGTLNRMAQLTDIANGRPAQAGKPWTSRDVARLKGMQKAGMPIEAMADALERSVGDIKARLSKRRPSTRRQP